MPLKVQWTTAHFPNQLINPKRIQMPLNSFMLLCFCCFSLAYAATTWDYGQNGPSTWGGVCNTGSSQSPVNIVPASAVKTEMESLEFGNYDVEGELDVENNGHGVEVAGFANWTNRPYIQGGGLGAKYLLNQFHFHWAQSANGSEHEFDGVHVPLEIHMVHVKEGLTVAQALNQSNGLAVIGIFYKIGMDGTSLEGLEDAIAEVAEGPENKAELSEYSPSVHLPDNLNKFYRYNGSLTTPDCQEAVVWTVMAHSQTITQEQLDLFRTVRGANGQVLATNVRPVQPLNARKVQVVRAGSGFFVKQFSFTWPIFQKTEGNTSFAIPEFWQKLKEFFMPKKVGTNESAY